MESVKMDDFYIGSLYDEEFSVPISPNKSTRFTVFSGNLCKLEQVVSLEATFRVGLRWLLSLRLAQTLSVESVDRPSTDKRNHACARPPRTLPNLLPITETEAFAPGKALHAGRAPRARATIPIHGFGDERMRWRY